MVDIKKEILYPQIQGVTASRVADVGAELTGAKGAAELQRRRGTELGTAGVMAAALCVRAARGEEGLLLNFRSGYYDLDSLSIADVEKVEIVRGGGAVLYGSDTSGGDINIITKKKRTNSISYYPDIVFF